MLLLDAATVSEVATNPNPNDIPPVPDEPLVDDIVTITFNDLASPKRTRGCVMCLVGYIGDLPI